MHCNLDTRELCKLVTNYRILTVGSSVNDVEKVIKVHKLHTSSFTTYPRTPMNSLVYDFVLFVKNF